MTFAFEYLDFDIKAKQSKSISLLRSFVNFYLADKFYGFDIDGIWIAFYKNPSASRKLKCKKVYKKYLSIEVAGNFSGDTSLNLTDFAEGFRLVKEAVEIANNSGVTAGDDFQGKQLLIDLSEIQSNIPSSQKTLNIFSNQEKKIRQATTVKSVDCYIKAWQAMPRPLTKRLMGVRVYPKYSNSQEGRLLMPYSYMFSEIFSTVLRNENIMTPGYSEIYFSVGETLDEAKTEIAVEDWHKYTYAAIEISSFSSSTEFEKEKIVFDALCDALRLIADFDHFGKEKIEHAIASISKEGSQTLLTYSKIENADYIAAIEYQVEPDHRKNVPFYLHLVAKSSGKNSKKLIGEFDTLWLAHYMTTMKFSKGEVVITGKRGLRGELSRRNAKVPDEYRFKIDEMLNPESLA
jgi:hypothetical protein